MQRDKDRELLVKFISKVYAWLDACYAGVKPHGIHWPVLSVYKELRPLGRDAWNEFKSDHKVEEYIKQINELSEVKLKAHGLYGKQLDFKLSVIDYLVDKINKLKEKGIPGRFRPKLVDAIDVLLDSLIGALGTGTALKELKDILRAQIH